MKPDLLPLLDPRIGRRARCATLSVQLTCTSGPLDHLKLLDDPSTFMKVPEPQFVQPFGLVD